MKQIPKGLKKHGKMIITALIILIVWVIVFWGFFRIRPQESVIYYQGCSEESEFQVNEIHTFLLRIKSGQNYGEISFGSDPDKMMYIVNQELSPDSVLENLDVEAYWGQDIFPFDQGSATLQSADYLTLTIRMDKDEALSYLLRVERVPANAGTGFVSQVTITNLPEEAVVTIHSNNQIYMAGNTSGDKMRAGEYEVLYCDSVSFTLLSPPSEEPAEDIPTDGWQACPMNLVVNSFQVKNSERQMLEFTVDTQTEFREIGHISLSGDAEQDGSLTVDISDLSAYPLPVTLSGSVGRLEIEGHSIYPTPKRWLRENMTQILMALMGVIFSAIIIMPKSDQ